MESSQLSGGTEECSSSESGWTTYLASPMHDDDDHSDEEEEDDDDYDDDHNDDDNDDDDHGDDNDDDSMASDASSGPGHREHPSRNGEGDHGMAPFKHNEDEDEDDNKCSSYKKAYNQVGKKRRKNAASTGKGTSAANSASSRVQGLPRSYKIGYDGGRVDGPMW